MSRIRRDPPPPVKKVSARERDERDVRGGVIGVIAFALAIGILLFAFGIFAGWSPAQYTINL